MQKAFYFDQTRCISCHTCVVSCKDWKEIKPGTMNLRRLTATEQGAFPSMRYIALSMACNHCGEPACLVACPAGAITKRPEDGIVLVDRSVCQNFRTCLAVCPYGAPQFSTDEDEPLKDSSWLVDHPMNKCDMCIDRWAEGKKPVCVESCPQRALDAGTLEELRAKYPDATNNLRILPNSKYDPFGNILDKDTRPSLLVRPKKV